MSHNETSTAQRDVARPGRQGRPRRRTADRSRHDARPDGEGADAGRHEVRRRRSVPVRSARQHRLEQRRPERARGQDPVEGADGRLARRAGVAADRRRVGDGQRRGTQGVPHAGAQGVLDRAQARGPRRPALRHRPHRLGGQSRRSGRRIPPATRRRSPRRSARPPTSPRALASGSPPRGKSAGAACTASSATSSCWRW